MNSLSNAELLARAVSELDEIQVRVGASRTDNWRTVDRLARELGLTDAAEIDRLDDALRAHEEQAVRSGNPGQARVRRAKYPDRTTALDLWGSVKRHGPPWTTKERREKPDAESVSLHVSDDAPSAFLSHTHHDRQLALSLAKALAAEGIGSWRFETDIEEGDNIARCVREALETSDCLVVLVTEFSIASLWVLTELDSSVGLDMPIAMVLDTTNPLLIELFEAVRFPSPEPELDTRIRPAAPAIEGLRRRYDRFDSESRTARYVDQTTDFMATLPEYLRPWPRHRWRRMPMIAFPNAPRIWDGEIELVPPSTLVDLVHHLERQEHAPLAPGRQSAD